MYQLFGFDKNIKPGPESLCSVVNESDFPVFLKSVKNAFLTGHEHHVEYRIKRPSDGEVRWIDCRGKVVLDKEGKPEKVSGFVQDITERKTNELNLINNEKKYRRLFEMSEDPMWMVLDDKLILANRSAAKTLAYETVDEIINISPWQVSPEYQPDGVSSKDKALEMISTAFKNRYHRFDWVLVDKNGINIPVEVSLTRIPFSGQEALFCIWRDISVRKTAEKKLKKSEERWQFALEGNGEGVWDWNITTDEVFFSKQHSAMRGYQEGEISNHLNGWKNCIHPDDIDRVYCALNKHLEHKSPIYECEYRLLCKDGTYKWILDRGKVVEWSDDQKALRMIGTHMDITPRREAEKKLQLSSSVFTHTYEGIVITDNHQKIIDANPAFFEITGYSREEIIGQNPSILRSDRQDAHYYQSMWQDINENDYWQGEIWNLKKGGEYYAELLTISVLKNDAGEITNYLGVFTDITETKLQQEKLDLMAYYDVLTKLPNRALFIDRFNQAVAHSKRSNSHLAICYIDLDKFKPINDNYGHEIGDQILIEVAKRIIASIREEDTVSRQGGDEFALLISNVESQAHCEQTLERIHYALTKPIIVNEISHQISASSGYTIYPNDTGDIDTLLRHADQAMYQAKQSGRNRYLLFDAEQDQQTTQKQRQLNEIEQALNHHEFQLYYQPKINMATGKITGAEALIRWLHPTKGVLQPLSFLPLVEATDLEIQIGDWVIEQAFQQLARWQQAGIELQLSINIASHHLLSHGFLAKLKQSLITHAAIDPKYIQLEILETSALGNLQLINDIINTCQNELGVSIALDDFGTGYSSLIHLRHLSAATIKIDQSFVQKTLDDPNDCIIIDGVIGLAGSFHRDVIAEGVETTAHGLMLLIMGCEQAQGFAIAKPLPEEKFIHWLKNYKPNQEWLSYSHKNLTEKEKKKELFKLIITQWTNKLATNINSPFGGIKEWPIMDIQHCHCGVWLKRVRKEVLFKPSDLTLIEKKHEEIHAVGNNLLSMYLQGDLEAAREGVKGTQVLLNQLLEIITVA